MFKVKLMTGEVLHLGGSDGSSSGGTGMKKRKSFQARERPFTPPKVDSIQSSGKALYDLVAYLADIDRDGFKLMAGFPPSIITDCADKTLEDCRIRQGEMILCRPKVNPTSASSNKKMIKKASTAKPRRGGRINLESKEDVAEKLVNALSNSSSKGTVDVFLRKATKLAVLKQYEIAEGTIRFKAALEGNYTFITDLEDTKKTIIQYSRSSRSYGRESFELLNKGELSATLIHVLGLDHPSLSEEEKIARRETLKPDMMAQLSPRVFWSLVKFCHANFEDGLKELVPQQDWSFVDVRHRKRSEKAIQAEQNRKEWEERKRLRRSSKAAKRVLSGKGATLTSPETPEEQDQFSKDCVLEIVDGDESIVKKLEAIEIVHVFDLYRLRVPGRIEFAAEETELTMESLRAYQRKAQDLVEKHSFLKEYRTRG